MGLLVNAVTHTRCWESLIAEVFMALDSLFDFVGVEAGKTDEDEQWVSYYDSEGDQILSVFECDGNFNLMCSDQYQHVKRLVCERLPEVRRKLFCGY